MMVDLHSPCTLLIKKRKKIQQTRIKKYCVLVGKSSRYGQKWRSRDETIVGSLQQYGLAGLYIDVVAADSSKPLWRHSHSLFDAVITDRETLLSIGPLSHVLRCSS